MPARMCGTTKVYIYGLTDPRSGEVRYVGKTVNLVARLGDHIRSAISTNKPLHKDRWIRRLVSEGHRPEIVILEETTPDRWAERERHWIAAIPNLTNMTSGGEGVDAPRTPEWVAKIGAAHRGKKLSPEQCERMSRNRLAEIGDHCKHGHEFTVENTVTRTKRGKAYRSCRTCERNTGERLRRKRGALPWSGRTFFVNRPREMPRREFCFRGHPLSGENMRVVVRKRADGINTYEEHVCRKCVLIRSRLNAAKKREAIIAR